MGRIVVFGAGGRAGRAAVTEAVSRGHQVTAVVRDPGRHAELPGEVVTGDVTDRAAVARVAAGHDAAVAAVFDPAGDFYSAAARALLGGLGEAGVHRLISVGLASVLAGADGTALMDTPGYPQEYRDFYLAHAAGNEVLRTTGTDVDWLVVSPAGDFDHGGARTGRYWPAAARADSRISYADLAIALVDEIETPKHHRIHLGVETGRAPR